RSARAKVATIRDPDIRMPYRDMAAQWRRMTQQYEDSPQARPRKRCPWRGHLFSLAPARSAIGTKRRIDVMQLIGLQDLLYFLRDPWPWGKPHEAAGIHRTSRQRCSRVSACCARPARGQDPAYRHH